jgi:glutamate decarboxylase
LRRKVIVERTEGCDRAKRRISIDITPLFPQPGEAPTRSTRVLDEGPMFPQIAHHVVHDEAMLDGNARLNLATVVGTWMDPNARHLSAEIFDLDMIDGEDPR